MSSKKVLSVLLLFVILISIIIFVFFVPSLDQLNGKYIAKAQLNEGFFAFASYEKKLLDTDKVEAKCLDFIERQENYKYVETIQLLTNNLHSKCYFIVTMKNNKTVEKRIRGITLIFSMDLAMNKIDCYTNISKENSYLVEYGKYCKLEFPEYIEKNADNYFEIK